MKSRDIKWKQVTSNKIKCNPVKSNDILWNQMNSGEITWNHMKSYEIKWNKMSSIEIIGHQLKVNEHMYDYVSKMPIGILCKKTCCAAPHPFSKLDFLGNPRMTEPWPKCQPKNPGSDTDDDNDGDDDEPTTATPHSYHQANTHRGQISCSEDTASLWYTTYIYIYIYICWNQPKYTSTYEIYKYAYEIYEYTHI